ncbi:MAG: hypothetical protein WBE13_05305, partial [Candidatus Acidiferrum sp.]
MQFDPGPPPRIRADADYELRNTGNQPLSSIEVRLSARRRFRIAQSEALWDGASLTEQNVAAMPRDTLLLLSGMWNVGERHTLHLYSEFQTPAAGETGFSFSSDAFFLPSQGWA